MGSTNENENQNERIPEDVNKGHVRNQDFIENVAAEATGVDKMLVKDVFNACWQAICEELEYGNSIKLHGKGHFYLSRRSRRIGRNPATGEEFVVPEREAMAFQTSPAYAKRLRERRAHWINTQTGENDSESNSESN